MRNKNKIIGLGVFLFFVFAAFLLPGCGTQHSVGTYTVAYNANGATAGDVPTDPTRYQADLSVTVPGNTGNLQKAGYVFAGWNTNPSGTGTNYTQGQKFDIKSSNAVLYACWSDRSVSFTVTYNGNGNTSGTVPTDSNNYRAGHIVTVPGNTGSLAKTGYVFAGWNTKADGTGVVYTQADTFAMGLSNITLYANWSANTTYTVTYNGNGSTSGTVPVDTTNYETGYTVTVLGNTGSLARTGYTFAGWNTAADGSGVTYTFGQEFVMGAANVTLYAKWTTTTTYTVTYSGNGNTSGSVPTDSTNYPTGQTVTVLGNTGNLEKTGYNFDGWNTSADGTGASYTAGNTFAMGSSNIILYAKWKTNTNYTVTYDGNGNTSGTAPTDSSVYQPGYTVTALGNTGTLEKTGYVFAGWNTKADGSGVVYTQADTFAMGFSNVTLYANWSSHTTYTVTYEANGATSGDVPVDTTHYETGYSVTVLDNTGNLQKTGYSFAGWNTRADGTGTTYSHGQEFIMGSANVVLYAKWASSTYTVSYSGNGNTSGYPPVDVTNYETGQTVPVFGNTGNLEKTDYRFTGWNTNAEGSGTTYTPGQTFSMGSENMTLYAKWSLDLCLVNFNSMGGSSVPSQEVLYGAKVTEPSDPTKSGYTFAGWFKDIGCTNPWFFDTDRATSDMTLYAKWTINEFTVSFNPQGGSTVPPQTIEYGHKANKPTDPIWSGKTFTGWFKNQECTESWVFDVDVVTDNVTLYAGWKDTVYTVTFDSKGGTSVDPQTIQPGGYAAMPTRPVNGNLALAGWYREDACITQWTFCQETVNSDITLYAKWTTYSIRDVGPAGGWVFYDKGSYSDGWRYIEAAPSDISYPWGWSQTTNATGTNVGDGANNTTTIINVYGQGGGYAALACRQLVVGDYSDWFMPALDEMDFMRSRLYNYGVGNLKYAYYWTSSERDRSNAYLKNFKNGQYDYEKKTWSTYVRPARYF